MVKAGELLLNFYGSLTHVTCTAHLFHNACLKIKSFFPEVDNLIATVKAATRKNRTRREMFRQRKIPIPPAPVVVRWGTWLKAALYYATHFTVVREIFSSISGGKLVTKAKEALADPKVFESLISISGQYQKLESVFDDHINDAFTIKKAYRILEEFEFAEDSCNIKRYLSKRMRKNGLAAIMLRELSDVSPRTYTKLERCPATSIAVERSFSMLKKLNAHDRNFKEGNIENYLICKYNSQFL